MIVDLSEYKNKAGIYKWENKLNRKCYIGQAKDLYRRLRHHFSNIKTKRYDNPLYRAVAKYGVDNFDITIIEVLEASDDLNKRLDEREIYYIEYYKSYSKGYNQTKGGDGGITGYKFTEEQRKKVSENSKKIAKLLYKKVYLYDTFIKRVLIYNSIANAREFLNISHSQISKTCSWKQFIIGNRYIGAFDICSLKRRIIFFYKYGKLFKYSSGYRKPVQPGLKRHFNTPTGKKVLTAEWKKKIGDSLYKYSVLIYENGKLFKEYDNTRDANEFFKYGDENNVLKTVKRSIRLNSVYKKKYTFKLIEKQ